MAAAAEIERGYQASARRRASPPPSPETEATVATATAMVTGWSRSFDAPSSGGRVSARGFSVDASPLHQLVADQIVAGPRAVAGALLEEGVALLDEVRNALPIRSGALYRSIRLRADATREGAISLTVFTAERADYVRRFAARLWRPSGAAAGERIWDRATGRLLEHASVMRDRIATNLGGG